MARKTEYKQPKGEAISHGGTKVKPATIKKLPPTKLADKLWRMDNLYHIVNEDGKLVKFRLRPIQRHFIENMWHRNIILKSRQHGFTTLIEIWLLDTALFIPNFTGVIIAHKKDDASTILQTKVEVPYANLHPDIMSQVGIKALNKGLVEFTNGSVIKVTTSGRSGTAQGLHICLHEDTEIAIKHNFTKRIVDVAEGDLVMNENGSYQKVKKVLKNRLSDMDQRLIEIDTFGHYEPLRITNEHRVLTRGKNTTTGGRGDTSGTPTWKAAGEIEKGDYIAFPVREVSNKCRDGLVQFGEVRIEPESALGWISGLYLAEGTIREGHNTEVTFGVHEDEVTRTVQCLERLYPALGPTERGSKLIRVYEHKNSKTVSITVNSRNLNTYLTKRYGNSKDKHIPDSVWNLGVEHLKSLLMGYLDGDGSWKNVNQVQVTSIRRQLIDQVKMIMLTLRLGMPTIYYLEAGVHSGRNCKAAWTLKLNGSGNWKLRELFEREMPEVPDNWAARYRVENGKRPGHKQKWRRGRKHYWMQVTDVRETQQCEYVYDIVLEKHPHNYVTRNGVVHNSEYGYTAKHRPDVAEEILLGSLPAVHQKGYVFIESTADGAVGEFFDLSMTALNGKREGKYLTPYDFKFFFYAWFDKAENTLTEEEAELVPIRNEITKYFQELEETLGRTFTKGQKAWYSVQEDIFEDKMKQEHPSTPEEAFENSGEGNYYVRHMKRVREEGRMKDSIPYDRREVIPYWDIGVNDPACCWFIKRVGMWYHVVGYYEDTDNGMDWHIPTVKKLAEDQGWNLASTWFGPHDMKQRSKGQAKTLVQECKEYGANFTTIDRVEQKILSIQASRKILASCVFDKSGPNMEIGISRLDQYRKEWNKSLQVWNDKPRHDIASNGADAFQGFAMAVDKEMVEEGKPKAQPDPRRRSRANVGKDGKPLSGQPKRSSRMRGFT